MSFKLTQFSIVLRLQNESRIKKFSQEKVLWLVVHNIGINDETFKAQVPGIALELVWDMNLCAVFQLERKKNEIMQPCCQF